MTDKKIYIFSPWGLLLLGSALLMLSSCENFFHTYMEVPPPPYKQMIVMNLYIDDQDTLLQGSVSRNAGSLETLHGSHSLLLDDATVLVKDERGEIVSELEYITPAGEDLMVNYVGHLPAPFGGNGHVFTVEVTHPDYDPVTATQTMPWKPEITVPVFKKEGGEDDYNGNYSLFTFNIKDRPGEDNYYQIRAYYYIEDENGDDQTRMSFFFSLESDDPLFEYSPDYNSLIIRDKTFDGQDYPVKMRAYGIYYYGDEVEEPEDIFVEVTSLSRDYYLYARSLERAMEMEDVGFFIEPVQVYNNLQNGLGIFALSASITVKAIKE